ncbi:MAG: hypothetical protein LN417_06765 [Candidatus Thermoplasmatota archaeon]|nr:hypothetical protein [Candidatus Thermoplasmatota archaeon]
MPEEEELEDAVNSIRDLGDIADLMRCPNCGEMTDANRNICESCGFLIGGTGPPEEELTHAVDGDFEERLNMTLKPTVPSEPRRSSEAEPSKIARDFVETEVLPTAPEEPIGQRTHRSIETVAPVRLERRSNAVVISSVIAVIAGIATYMLSFFLVADRVLAGATMVLGAVLIVIFGNVAVEGAFASRRPVLVAESPRRKTVQYACPDCKTALREEELECPICGAVFES